MNGFPVQLSGAPNTLMWANEYEIEPQALQQLRNISKLPWIHGLRVMPDVHFGKGATVGSVIAMRNAVSPSAVGVDIGCGMEGVQTSLTANDLPDNLHALRTRIESYVPVGFNMHDDVVGRHKMSTRTKWHMNELWDSFDDLDPAVHGRRSRAGRQMGTLGGGNHFIEVCLDENERVWLMLHSGSRNIGKEIAERHIGVAKTLTHNVELPDAELSVFLAGTPEMDAYRRDLTWAQNYAAKNRAVMLDLVKQAVVDEFPTAGVTFGEQISCHHNYVAEEEVDGEKMYITRKGAIRAGAGDLGLIPGSMGTGSYVVRGLGSVDSFASASHGAGRKMSRGKAKRTFTVDDLVAQTEGVESRKDRGVLDEIPGAYKDINEVVAAQANLVEVVAFLRQIVCVKG
ncbi:RtcB family protein [Gordonia sp. TBRC 11910]|uniref:3'-phosphate/5'-hydroxy nucleic acid ligase n=1 Tax=Gordonia asplenii TaxID=2725283 RepID=A0A848L1K8_9ACTN|nr:RtcB family protein [Gordonia asplenii]NMO04589.1 RtcB family protein [Gordonia asplenii]